LHPEKIASLLRRAVRERVLPPGQALNQDELARRLGVSRIPLREALRTLSGEGLIVMRPGMGAVVFELDADEVEELYDLRLQLEPPLARFVAEQVRPQDVDELAGLVRRMAEETPKPDPEEWSGLHYAFRRRLYEMPGRRHSLRLVTQLLNLVEPYSRYYAHVLGAQDRVGVDLREEVGALQDRDGHRLADLIGGSIRRVRQALVEAMRSGDQDKDRWDEPFLK
jgi:DNA-binding GntR family transcriptional regulator